MRRLTLLAALSALLLGILVGPARAASSDLALHPEHRFHALVFSKVTNFYHESIPAGIAAIEQLGAEHNFGVEVTDDAAIFNDTDLARFDVVIFNNTNSTPQSGDLLNAEQRAALQRYIHGGGGWLGLHAASASERDWDWYEGLVGAIFENHPTPQVGRIKVLDRVHPSTRSLPELWERTEEWYNWRANPTGNVHTLAQIKVRDGISGLNEGVDHPYSWCQNYEGGRSWFTAGGHFSGAFDEPLFLDHLLGGIEWAAGAVPGDCGATVHDNFQRVPLVTEGLADPFELAVTPDRRVIYVQRTGEVKVLDQESFQVSTALDFDYSLELTSQSDGLLGITLDPSFAETGWLYLLHSDKEEKQLNLSRFTLTGTTIDAASEERLLEIPTWRGEARANVHMAGSLAMGPDGNLYASIGDNTDPFQSDGFTPIDERDGRRAFDAQATSGNTNDLRGKVIRIHPEADGTYTVPEGNLFAPGTPQTKPEIYAMGFRNPFRITVDPNTGALLVADYGPDSRQANPDRGPEGTVEFNRITEAGNYGWPYCVGNNIPFNDYDFATDESGPKFNCDNPVNDSPNNTGLTELPPAQPALVWYAYSASEEFPELGTGGGGPMGGPVYDFNPDLDRKQKFPEYFDGKWIVYELTRNWFKTLSIHATDQEFQDPRFDPVKAGDLLSINDTLGGMSWIQAFDAEFGPDGSLYVIDFGAGSGTGRGGTNEGSGIYRIDYVTERAPIAEASVTPDSGRAPLTVEFSSEGSTSPDQVPITYAWDFDGDGTTDSTDANPTHTYTEVGQYEARLTVSDTRGLTGTAVVTVTVGNTRPDVRFGFPPDGGFFEFGDTLSYEVAVRDPEDDPIDCDRVTVQTQLGHDDHQHPLDNLSGCSGTVVTDTGDSHGPGQNLYYALAGQYEDAGGQGGVPPLVGSKQIRLRPQFTEAEHFDSTGGPNGGVQALDRPASSGGSRIGEIEDGDWIAFEPVNLHAIQSVTVGASSDGMGGVVEFRADAPDGQLLGKATVPVTDNWNDIVSPTVRLAGTNETITLYAVFRNPEWTPQSPDVLALDWLRFNGAGVTEEPGGEVGFSARPTSGPPPLEVDFSAEVTPPPGRTITDYHWSFGDNADAEGETATHTYGREGIYTARLTVTDSTGATMSKIREVAVGASCDRPQWRAEPGYTSLFDGTEASLAGWTHIGPGSFELTSSCELLSNGGNGLLWYSDRSFTDYSLRLDWMMPGDDNSGVFVGFPDPGGDMNVARTLGHEVQIDPSDAPDKTTGSIYNFQSADIAARDAALNPPGEWNTFEIVLQGKTIAVYLNGTEINEFTTPDPNRLNPPSYFGVQNHGSADDVYFRNIRIKEL